MAETAPAAPAAQAAPAGAITSDNLKPAAAQAEAGKDAAAAEGTVMVRPAASYFDSGTNQHRSPGGDAYAVTLTRAADLVRQGLADYDRPEDETKAIEARVKAEGDAIRARRGR